MSIEAPLRKIISESGISFRENASSFIFTCPKCQKPKLAMYKISGRFLCYHCQTSGFKGRPEWALSELLGRSIDDLKAQLYGDDLGYMPGRLEIHLEDLWGEDEGETLSIEVAVQPTELPFPPDYIGIDQPMAFVKGARYLWSRGITSEHVRTYDIRYSPIEKRVVFPVKVEGKLIGWQSRFTGPTKVWNEAKGSYYNIPKVLTSASLQGKGGRWLMFQDRLRGSAHAVLSEGPVTSIHTHKCGGNVASMGKSVTLFQLDIIRRNVKKLYIAPSLARKGSE